ncbi:quinoprotein dehydrogenase-associated SoxYZ-like carrier [Rhodobacteraceae bacterium NNCM2]|nr:quinoprotein dehydrogenase-associated SoxYZ-like carrier [Coraliihabitans acroporae]
MFRIFAAIAASILLSATAHAGGYKTVEWSDLKAEIYGDAAIQPGDNLMVLEAPYRSPNDAEVPVSLSAQLLDGRSIRSVTLIIDENPMPVSAKWTFETPRHAVSLGANMRFNGPSPLRAIIETTDGQRYMTERFVKTSGLATCSAPPIGDPEAAIARIGEMEVFDLTPPSPGIPNTRRARLELSHPQHTGMQMDQITLHFILARYMDALDVWAGEEKLFTLEGSISLSEDPEIEFDFPNNGAETLKIRMHDTMDTVIEREVPFGTTS